MRTEKKEPRTASSWGHASHVVKHNAAPLSCSPADPGTCRCLANIDTRSALRRRERTNRFNTYYRYNTKYLACALPAAWYTQRTAEVAVSIHAEEMDAGSSVYILNGVLQDRYAFGAIALTVFGVKRGCARKIVERPEMMPEGT